MLPDERIKALIGNTVALLAVLDDHPLVLSETNPYSAGVQQAVEAIQSYQKGDQNAR